MMGKWHLFLGVVYPGAVIAIELATHMCAEAFFDPMPTFWHVLLVIAVPVSNFLIWRHLRLGGAQNPKWLAFSSGTSLAVAGVYTLLFLPLYPLALIAIVFVGMGLLPLAPAASLASAVVLSLAVGKQSERPAFLRCFAGGMATMSRSQLKV